MLYAHRSQVLAPLNEFDQTSSGVAVQVVIYLGDAKLIVLSLSAQQSAHSAGERDDAIVEEC